MMRTLASPYVFWFFLCSSSVWRRAGGVSHRSIFRHSDSDRNDDVTDVLYIKKASALDKVSFHLFIVAVGLACALMCSFFYLLLAYVTDSFSRRDMRVRSEKVKRSRIPKIVLARAQTEESHFDDDVDEEEEEEYGDETDDAAPERKMQPFRLSKIEHLGDRSPSYKKPSLTKTTQQEKTTLIPLMATPSHLPTSGMDLVNENVHSETQEEYLKWLKSIHMILQITYAVQPHLQVRTNEESINTKELSVKPSHETG